MSKASVGGSRLTLRPTGLSDSGQWGVSNEGTGEDLGLARALAASLASDAQSGATDLAVDTSRWEEDESADLAAAIAASLGSNPSDTGASLSLNQTINTHSVPAPEASPIEAPSGGVNSGSSPSDEGILKRKSQNRSPAASDPRSPPDAPQKISKGGDETPAADIPPANGADSLESVPADVPAEPEASAEGSITIAVRLPDGRLQRRFLRSETVVVVEGWLRQQGQDMQRYVLSKQFPRKVGYFSLSNTYCEPHSQNDSRL